MDFYLLICSIFWVPLVGGGKKNTKFTFFSYQKKKKITLQYYDILIQFWGPFAYAIGGCKTFKKKITSRTLELGLKPIPQIKKIKNLPIQLFFFFWEQFVNSTNVKDVVKFFMYLALVFKLRSMSKKNVSSANKTFFFFEKHPQTKHGWTIKVVA